MVNGQEEINLILYLQIISRWKWLIIIPVAAALLASFAITYSQPSVFEVTAVVELSNPGTFIYTTPTALNPAQLNPGSLYLVAIDPAKINPIVLRDTATSDAALKKIRQILKLEMSVSALRSKITIEKPEGTNLMSITIKDSLAQRSKAIADILTKIFVQTLQRSDRQKQNLLKQKLASLEKQLQEIEQHIKTAQATISQAESEPQRTTITASTLQALGAFQNSRMELNQDKYNVQSQLSDLKISGIVRLAEIPKYPQKKPLLFNIVFAGILTLIITVVLAFLLDYIKRGRESI